MRRVRIARPGFWILAGVLVAFPLFAPSSFAYDLAIRIALASVVVIGLNLLFGYAGQISLGHGAFVGAGGYGSAVLTTHLAWPPLAAMAIAAAAVGLIAFAIARPILRLQGHHLAMATLALLLVSSLVFTNESRWTGGSDGMPVPPLGLGGWTVSSEPAWYALAAGFLLATTWAALNLVASPAGRALQAIRGSETAARLSGIDVAAFKTRVFVLSAVLASLSGSLTAHYVAFVSPSAVGLFRSIEFVMMVVLGGFASVFGSIVGAALITLLPQVLHAFERWETLALGVLLTTALIVMPSGIVPTLRRLVRKRRIAGANAPQEP